MSIEAMKQIADIAEGSTTANSLQHIAKIARAAIEQAEKQEPVAWANPNDLTNFDMKVRTNGGPLHTVPLYTTSPTYDQGWKDGYKHGAWANTAAPVQEPDLTEIPMIMTCTKCGAFGEAMLTLETQPAQKPVNVTSKMVQAFLYAAGRHFPWGGSDPAIEDGIKAALEAMPTPPAAQREWVGLTDEQLQEIEAATWGAAFLRPQSARDYYRAIEARLREKNGGQA